jgi:hypothetical protein
MELETRKTADLLMLHSAILDELRRRDVVRSSNSPAGDYGELLFSRAFGWSLENNSSSGHDATDAFGTRFQIKCRRVTVKNPSRQLSFIRNLPAKPFDFLAGVVLDANYRVLKAAIIPFEIVLEKSSYTRHVNGWRLILRDAIWALPNVRDVTLELQAAEIDI